MSSLQAATAGRGSNVCRLLCLWGQLALKLPPLRMLGSAPLEMQFPLSPSHGVGQLPPPLSSRAYEATCPCPGLPHRIPMEDPSLWACEAQDLPGTPWSRLSSACLFARVWRLHPGHSITRVL